MSWRRYDVNPEQNIFVFLARQYYTFKLHIQRHDSFPPGGTLKSSGLEYDDELSGINILVYL